jgi:signal peptidase I
MLRELQEPVREEMMLMSANTRDNRQMKAPAIPQLEAELKRERYHQKFRNALKNTIFVLITVAAIAVLVATLLLPVFRIYGTSMTPTLDDGEIVLSLKSGDFDTGDVVAFYYNNKVLVKRVIAGPGDWVDIKADGTVYVNDEELDEPYVVDKSYGECNIEFPYQVPESRYFVMGDHRSVSVDSRNTSIGCISDDQVVGRLVMKIWPLTDIGTIN